MGTECMRDVSLLDPPLLGLGAQGGSYYLKVLKWMWHVHWRQEWGDCGCSWKGV
jgi:hypothetical protein